MGQNVDKNPPAWKGRQRYTVDQTRPWPSKTQSSGAFTQPRGECWHHNQKATYRGGGNDIIWGRGG